MWYDNEYPMKHIVYFIFTFIVCCIIASCNAVDSNISDDTLVWFEKAKYYESEGDAANAMICYLNALDNLKERQDTVLKVSAYTRLGDFHFRYGMYEKAVENHRKGYNIALRMKDDKLICESAGKLGLDYLMLNQKDTARYFIERYHAIAFENKLQNVFKDDYGLCSMKVKESDLNSVVKSVRADSLGTLVDREKLMSLEADFNHEKALLREENTRKNNMINIATGLFLFGAFSALSFFFYRGRKKAEINLDNIIKENNDMKGYYDCRENYLCEQEKQLRIKEELLLSGTNVGAVALINKMKSSPSYMPVNTADEWNSLFMFADSLFPGFSVSLDAVDELTERDKEISCLVKLGFTTGQLAIFYGISPGSVTKAKFRIQKKIEVSRMSGISTLGA